MKLAANYMHEEGPLTGHSLPLLYSTAGPLEKSDIGPTTSNTGVQTEGSGNVGT